MALVCNCCRLVPVGLRITHRGACDFLLARHSGFVLERERSDCRSGFTQSQFGQRHEPKGMPDPRFQPRRPRVAGCLQLRPIRPAQPLEASDGWIPQGFMRNQPLARVK